MTLERTITKSRNAKTRDHYSQTKNLHAYTHLVQYACTCTRTVNVRAHPGCELVYSSRQLQFGFSKPTPSKYSDSLNKYNGMILKAFNSRTKCLSRMYIFRYILRMRAMRARPCWSGITSWSTKSRRWRQTRDSVRATCSNWASSSFIARVFVCDCARTRELFKLLSSASLHSVVIVFV